MQLLRQFCGSDCALVVDSCSPHLLDHLTQHLHNIFPCLLDPCEECALNGAMHQIAAVLAPVRNAAPETILRH